ncbi:LLM class flavin-dependent oxidoreductase [Microbacterium sp. BR1]|uniref:LLM class flavin-dependent oxidoreductase n=1 Tax=Microbacterium sp. BR1 TaxID=1070896 RepID=UPI000C2BF0D9|nr:LLM class flavin-dependent oxidoreductase [Microbacterium sp. BR1]
MVKPIIQLYPVLPATDEATRGALRPIGRNAELYQDVVHGMTDIVKAADDLGFWGISTIEHHFHSEGYEVSPSPSILNAYWAGQVRNARIGALGYTMSSQDPFRVAENTAIIDHLARGRSFVGFSRGYQARWTDILGQHAGVEATLSPAGMTDQERIELGDRLAAESSADRRNRDMFEENVDLVLRSWTSESITNDGYWQVPVHPERAKAWGMAPTTSRLGAPGEVDENGVIQRVSVVPAPLQKPHPPVFVASAASQETVEYAARRGFIPAFFSSTARAAQFGDVYVDVAKEAGREVVRGQNMAMVRWMQIGDTDAQARAAVEAYDLEMYRNLYRPLTPRMPLDEADPVQSVLDSGLWTAGTIDAVREQFVEQWKLLPAEYCVLIFHYAQQPKESVIRNLELFMKHVKPELDKLTPYER